MGQNSSVISPNNKPIRHVFQTTRQAYEEIYKLDKNKPIERRRIFKCCKCNLLVPVGAVNIKTESFVCAFCIEMDQTNFSNLMSKIEVSIKQSNKLLYLV